MLGPVCAKITGAPTNKNNKTARIMRATVPKPVTPNKREVFDTPHPRQYYAALVSRGVLVPACREGCDCQLSEVKLKKGEPVEKALRRLKKKLDREGTLREARAHRHYEKPSEKRRRKARGPRNFMGF
mgnify:CR=1 FL=1